ncbi:hypothetical protein BN1088_20004 [Sphingobacterium sp. PM2-P1-29]|nr:hypothetical protein BN1088_20004 [Sphingobacterium sp. PM2-P1-29]
MSQIPVKQYLIVVIISIWEISNLIFFIFIPKLNQGEGESICQ